MLLSTIIGVAFGGPLQDPELLSLAEPAQRDLEDNLSEVAGRTVYVFQHAFADELAANAFVQRAQREIPGDDVVFFQLDQNRDGHPELLQMSRKVDAAQLVGLTYTVSRPLLIDTDGDGVSDRMALTGGLPRLMATASR